MASEEVSSRLEGADSTYTGAVGTGLYVAPEIFNSSKRLVAVSPEIRCHCSHHYLMQDIVQPES